MAKPEAVQLFEQIYAKIDKQVRDIVASMLPDVTIAAQDDGAVIANVHRILNFQGPGVTVSEEAPRRRVNVLIPGGAVAATTSVSVSAAGNERAYDNGTSATGPSGWQTLAFDHTAAGWTNSLTDTNPGMPTAPTGSSYVCKSLSAQNGNERHLFFRSVTLPAGTISSATLSLIQDDVTEGVWINGTLVYGETGDVTTTIIAIPTALLTAGAANALAIQVRNTPTGFPASNWMRLAYRLEVFSGTAGVDTRYQLLTDKGQANGYAGLDSNTRVPTAQLGSGSASSSTYLRGDSSWATVSAGMTNPMTTQDDIIVGGSSGTPARLAKGGDSQVLTIDPSSHHVAWAAAAGGAAFDGARYTTNAGQNIANNAFTVINFATSVYDTNSRVTTGASWHYTVGSGTTYLRISAFAGLVSGSWSGAGTGMQLGIFKNGAEVARLAAAFADAVTSGNSNMSVGGSTVLNVASGDTIDVRVYQNCGAARNLDADHKTVWCAMERVG